MKMKVFLWKWFFSKSCIRLLAVVPALIFPRQVMAQRIVFDEGHYAIVLENSMMRTSAALTHERYLEKIKRSLSRINLNMATVVTAQEVMYSGLSNVEGALRNGLMLKEMLGICSDIFSYSSAMVEMGRKEPYLLLFAEGMAAAVRDRSTGLMTELSRLVLHSGPDILMDYNARDELMKKVSEELHIILGLCYGGWKAMFWASQNGMIRSINPFARFINEDRRMVEDILSKTKYLKK